jgi:hypothetical protein
MALSATIRNSHDLDDLLIANPRVPHRKAESSE